MRLRQEALGDAGAQMPQPHGPKAGRVASDQSFASEGPPPVPPAGVRSIGRVPVLRQIQRQNARQDEQLVLTRADPNAEVSRTLNHRRSPPPVPPPDGKHMLEQIAHQPPVLKGRDCRS
jgi:hypothetical protein